MHQSAVREWMYYNFNPVNFYMIATPSGKYNNIIFENPELELPLIKRWHFILL